MINLQNVCAGYGETKVLSDISLEISDNVVIVGPNGCGKTTLLRVMSGLLPFCGAVQLAGVDLGTLSPRAIAKKVALLGQLSPPAYGFSVYETVMLGRYAHLKNRLLARPGPEDHAAVEDALRAVQCLALHDKTITRLSGGQLQRVFLAQTLAQAPEIILLDEPTNHLDLKCQADIVEYLKEWSSAPGRMTVGVLHDLNLAMLLCDDVIVMDRGRIAARQNARDLIASGVPDAVYGMDVGAFMRRMLSKW